VSCNHQQKPVTQSVLAQADANASISTDASTSVQNKQQSECVQVRGASGLPLDHSLPGSGADDWFPTATGAHRQMKTIGTTAELEQRPDSIQLFSPSSETAVTSDPILGGELVIRVVDAQVSYSTAASHAIERCQQVFTLAQHAFSCMP